MYSRAEIGSGGQVYPRKFNSSSFSSSSSTLTPLIRMRFGVASDILSMHDVIVALLVLVSLFFVS